MFAIKEAVSAPSNDANLNPKGCKDERCRFALWGGAQIYGCKLAPKRCKLKLIAPLWVQFCFWGARLRPVLVLWHFGGASLYLYFLVCRRGKKNGGMEMFDSENRIKWSLGILLVNAWYCFQEFSSSYCFRVWHCFYHVLCWLIVSIYEDWKLFIKQRFTINTCLLLGSK